jgi:hypothetical protein
MTLLFGVIKCFLIVKVLYSSDSCDTVLVADALLAHYLPILVPLAEKPFIITEESFCSAVRLGILDFSNELASLLMNYGAILLIRNQELRLQGVLFEDVVLVRQSEWRVN